MVAIFNTFKDLHFICGGPFYLCHSLAISRGIKGFSGVRMRFYNGFFFTIKVFVVFGTVPR